ncbi:hypothetical protein HK102_010554, partial [Quaeritorhiza haematococci]
MDNQNRIMETNLIDLGDDSNSIDNLVLNDTSSRAPPPPPTMPTPSHTTNSHQTHRTEIKPLHKLSSIASMNTVASLTGSTTTSASTFASTTTTDPLHHQTLSDKDMKMAGSGNEPDSADDKAVVYRFFPQRRNTNPDVGLTLPNPATGASYSSNNNPNTPTAPHDPNHFDFDTINLHPNHNPTTTPNNNNNNNNNGDMALTPTTPGFSNIHYDTNTNNTFNNA